MTGYGRDELADQTPRLLQGTHTDRAVVGSIKEKLMNREVFHGQTWNYRRSGEWFLMNGYCYSIYGERPKTDRLRGRAGRRDGVGCPAHETTVARQPD
jgi:hypothetical protein